MPGVESFDIQDDTHWRANVKIPLGLGGLKHVDRLREDRGARAGVREAAREGQRRRRDDEHGHLVRPDRGGGRATNMRWEADVRIAGPVALDGPARAPADRQPAGLAGARRARHAGAGGEGASDEQRRTRRPHAAPACAESRRRSARRRLCASLATGYTQDALRCRDGARSLDSMEPRRCSSALHRDVARRWTIADRVAPRRRGGRARSSGWPQLALQRRHECRPSSRGAAHRASPPKRAGRGSRPAA